MGSPLAPILANLFMGHYEQIWINQFPSADLLYYRRYVDDIFCVFRDEHCANDFLEFMNSRHVNIQFTIEKEQHLSLPFLDVQISRNGARLLTSVYRKKTYTGLLTNFFSFTTRAYKIGLLRCLIDRTFKICNTWTEFHSKISDLSVILQRNEFPSTLIDKHVTNFVNKAVSSELHERPVENTSMKYFSIPYIGSYSNFAQRRIQKLVKRYCFDLRICLAFSSFKIGRLFSTKDRLPLMSRSKVVYQFKCTSCGACYIGETHRNLDARISEHLTSKGSNIFKHLQEFPVCKQSYSISNFTILDYANTDRLLRLKESIHINMSKPSLNVQVHHEQLSLF